MYGLGSGQERAGESESHLTIGHGLASISSGLESWDSVKEMGQTIQLIFHQ
jgi:hypothetical protein